VFLSNGPGDPEATGAYAVPAIRGVIDSGVPTFGICLGHQMLGIALGGKTMKMHQGHHGANHPVKDLTTGKVEITSMNHGFAVDTKTLPDSVEETHVSLFDGSNCGLRLKDRPVFSVQYHPEASPGPHDATYLFDCFRDMMETGKAPTAEQMHAAQEKLACRTVAPGLVAGGLQQAHDRGSHRVVVVDHVDDRTAVGHARRRRLPVPKGMRTMHQGPILCVPPRDDD
jgi:anthranilate/para-aminobenzoate synthase component II